MTRAGVVLLLVLAACGGLAPTAVSTPASVRTFGILEAFDRASMALTFTEAEFLTGAAAEAAAARDGATAPNGYYVVGGPVRRSVPLSSAASVALLGWNAAGEMLTLPISADAFPGPSERWALTTYYWFTVAQGHIVAVEAQYTP